MFMLAIVTVAFSNGYVVIFPFLIFVEFLGLLLGGMIGNAILIALS
jgi:hypothetical protein